MVNWAPYECTLVAGELPVHLLSTTKVVMSKAQLPNVFP